MTNPRPDHGNDLSLYHYAVLDEQTWRLFAPLAHPQIRAVVKRGGLNQWVVAIGATFWHRQAGLIVVELLDAIGQATVRDFNVAPADRDGDVGALLFQTAEVVLRQRGTIRSMRVTYHLDEAPALYEMAMRGAGWPAPERVQQLFEMEWDLDKQRWVRDYRLPAGFTIIGWDEVTPAMIEQIERRHFDAAEGWYPEMCSPFWLAPELIDLPCSVALVYEGDVLGWILGERIEPTVGYCAVAFISPALRRTSLAGVAMMAEIARRHAAAGIRNTWIATQPGSKMAHFIEHVYGPFLKTKTEIWGGWKELSMDQDEHGDRRDAMGGKPQSKGYEPTDPQQLDGMHGM